MTIIGASHDACLAPRAVAFDGRISQVVTWSAFLCFFDLVIGGQSPSAQKLLSTANCLNGFAKGDCEQDNET